MAVKIRLRRVGAKKQPAYRIVVADARAPRDGRFIEIIGHYNPLTDIATVEIDTDRAVYWLRKGAQPTEVVQKMMVKKGVWAAFTGEAPPEAPAPIAAPEPVVEAAPEPIAEAVPEEAAEPVAEVAPEPAVEAEPVAATEQAPEPEPVEVEDQPVAEKGASAEETVEAEETKEE